MLEVLASIGEFILTQMDNIWTLCSSYWVLSFPIVLWILDRIFNIFDILKR